MALEITDTFTEPYSQSNASLPSSFSPAVVGINGVPYLLDTESGAYAREAFDVVQQRNTNDNRDTLLLPQDVWRQQAQSWHLGAGQLNMDRDDTLVYRFNSSYGIDPWTEWRLSLLNSTTQLGATSTLNGTTWLTNVYPYLVVVNDGKSYWYSSLSASASPVGSVTFSTGYTVIDLAESGFNVMALTTDRYVWTVSGPSATPAKWANHQYTTDVTFIGWEKDYLLVGDGNVLYNALKSNNPITVYTHPESGFRWYAAAEGSNQIYVLGRLNDKTTIHRVGIKADGTGLIPCIVAAQLPDGEIGYRIDSYLGFILIGTSKGVRVAIPDANGDLTLGSIIPTTEPVYCFEGQDRFVWFGNSAVDGVYSGTDENTEFPTATVSGLSRMDLSHTTVNALTPAYAQDISAVAVSGQAVRSVKTFQDKRVFSLDNGDVWFESSTLMPAGWIRQGIISYSVEDVKTGLYTQTKWEPLQGEVDLDISYDSGPFTRIANFDIQGSVRSGNTSMNGVQFSRMEPRVILKRLPTDYSRGPILTRLEVRAIPVKGRNSRWTLPIMNYEDIEIDQVPYKRDPLAVLNSLLSLVESGQLFVLQESGQGYTVHVKDYKWQPEKLTANGKSWQGLFTLVVEEVS